MPYVLFETVSEAFLDFTRRYMTGILPIRRQKFFSTSKKVYIYICKFIFYYVLLYDINNEIKLQFRFNTPDMILFNAYRYNFHA